MATSRRFALLAALALLAASCGSDKEKQPAAKPAAAATPAPTPAPTAPPATPAPSPTPSEPRVVETASGLKVEILDEGTGPVPQKGQRVLIHYVGTLPDGTEFDNSRKHAGGGQPFGFVLGAGQGIKAWDEGVAMMKVGGKARLTVPPSLGYGARAVGTIPPDSTLVFEIELMGVK